jgi:solute carrier family 25 S-adenosylmethionine transporter 26
MKISTEIRFSRLWKVSQIALLVIFSLSATTTTSVFFADAAAPSLAFTRRRVVQQNQEATPAGKKSVLLTPPTTSRAFSVAWWSYHARVGLAGGIAGAVGTTVLHPIDYAKTLRQSNPERYISVRAALRSIVTSKATDSSMGKRLYAGVVPAAVGAIPSSALYFGAYESMKSLLLQLQEKNGDESTFVSRLWVHTAAAASGNILSSAIFVPKEFLKQQLQYNQGSTVTQIVAKYGVRGLYRGYQATLMRNIPTAALRFVVYEELKWIWYTRPNMKRQKQSTSSSSSSSSSAPRLQDRWKLFAAGYVAGSLGSGLMTPVDVLKTRLATGQCPVDGGVNACFNYVLDTAGWSALYAGAGSRMFFSGAFSAIGFGTFEVAKQWLGVSSRTTKAKIPKP